MTYLYQACRAWVVDWFAANWQALKAKAIATLKKLRERNTGDR